MIPYGFSPSILEQCYVCEFSDLFIGLVNDLSVILFFFSAYLWFCGLKNAMKLYTLDILVFKRDQNHFLHLIILSLWNFLKICMERNGPLSSCLFQVLTNAGNVGKLSETHSQVLCIISLRFPSNF